MLVSNTEVQFRWVLVAAKMSNDIAEKVLEMIAGMYLNI